MDLQKEILHADFKERVETIAGYIGNNKDRFDTLMGLFFSRDYRTCQRASWILAHCVDNNISMIDPYLPEMVSNLDNHIIDATKRNTVRILQMVDIPEELWEGCLNHCFKYLESNIEPVAIRVFSMSVLYNVSQHLPEIKNELKMLIEDQMPYGSAGFQSRGRKILSKLSKELDHL